MDKKRIIDIISNTEKKEELNSIGICIGEVIEVEENVQKINGKILNGIKVVVNDVAHFIEQDLANCITWKDVEDE